jgi:hypothetical protein
LRIGDCDALRAGENRWRGTFEVCQPNGPFRWFQAAGGQQNCGGEQPRRAGAPGVAFMGAGAAGNLAKGAGSPYAHSLTAFVHGVAVSIGQFRPGQELSLTRPKQVVCTYFHFAASHKLTEGVRDSGCIAIAYETIVDAHGRLPPGGGGVRFSV